MRTKCSLGSPRGRHNTEYLGVDVRVLKHNEKGLEGVNWTHLAQDRDSGIL
jgi:hypothetical protein